MRKKGLLLIIVFVVVFNLLSPAVLYVKADEQPAVCSGPSEMMGKYFDFQEDMISILLGSSINEKRFSTSMGNGGLFTNQYLYLSGTTSALDLVSSSVLGGVQSLFSATTTSVVLLLLASASAVQSNLAGLVVLFKDRPIVRDYKQMMDIESELFDVAYFRSKQVDLTQPFDGNLLAQYTEVIKKYQDEGLLEVGTALPSSTASMADILWDLVWMNAAMKQFMIVGGEAGAIGLQDYRGCMGQSNQSEDCVAVLQFSGGAVMQLKTDYQKVGLYGACNRLASNINLTSKKTEENTSKGSDTAETKIKKSVEKLKSLFAHYSEERDDDCNLTEFEIAQLNAYWGNNWSCDEKVSLKLSAPASFNESKAVLEGEKEQTTNLFKEVASFVRKAKDNDYRLRASSKLANRVNKFNRAKKRKDKEQAYHQLYGSGYIYNPEFDEGLRDDFVWVYESISSKIQQSQGNAMAGDLSYQLIEIRGLLDQVDAVMSGSVGLKGELQNIADYQCSS